MLSGINSNTSSLFTSFFGTSSTSSTSATTTFLSDYASIKNGSYKKLLKAYYNLGNSNSTSSSSDATSESKDAATKLQATKLAATDLNKSAKALMEDKLFEKTKAVTNEETGEVTYDYDRDKIEAAVKSFVNDYNALIDDVGDASVNSILKKGVIITTATSANESLLGKVGITIGKGNKLEIDEEELKKASVTDIKSLFHDKYSYGSTVERNSSGILYSASSNISSYVSKYGASGVNYDYYA